MNAVGRFSVRKRHTLMSQTYYVRFCCLHENCDYRQWTILENLALSRREVHRREWNFDCPHHGPQKGLPSQVELKGPCLLMLQLAK